MDKLSHPFALVFGASGQIGHACADALAAGGRAVIGTARAADAARGIVAYDAFALSDPARALPEGRFGAVVWAQGANRNDSLLDFDADANLALYKANALFVAESLSRLIAEDRLAEGARLVVISSVWQTVARQAKLSYMMSKAALQGLVMSAAVDLAPRGILINAVLPGALDTPMTRANLSQEQIDRIGALTPFNRLPAIDDVAATTAFLCSPANTSITGQFIAVDLGFRNARLV
ncbi:MAG: SDR family oxidoreductase [Sphingomonadales bacterium]|nr:MAG: SDR family oxidoreductase [Sphingomonadales bacterium]